MMDTHSNRHPDTMYPGTSGANDMAIPSQSSVPAMNKQSLHLYLLERLYDLREKQEFCDLVFDIKGVKFFCHRIVVAAWSPFFYNQLYGQEVKKEFLKIQFDHLDVFTSFVNYMYSGYIDLQETNLMHVLRLASSFQVEPLRLSCETVLRCNLHVGNIISTHSIACKYKLMALEESTIAFLQMHLPDAVKEVGFLNLTAVRFNTFLSSESVQKLKPEIKLFLIISWLCYDVLQREQYFVALLQHINWSSVAKDFLIEISQTENFFTTNESSLYLLLQTLHASSISLGPYTDAFPSLREKYFDLLGQVVKNSVLEVIHEEYFPISVTQVSSVQKKPIPGKEHGNVSNKSVQTVVLSALTEMKNNVWNMDMDFSEVPHIHKEENSPCDKPTVEQDNAPKPVKRKCRRNKKTKIVEPEIKRNDSETDDGSEMKVPPLKLLRSKIKITRSKASKNIKVKKFLNIKEKKVQNIKEKKSQNKEKKAIQNTKEKISQNIQEEVENIKEMKSAQNIELPDVPLEMEDITSSPLSSDNESRPYSHDEDFFDAVNHSDDVSNDEEQFEEKEMLPVKRAARQKNAAVRKVKKNPKPAAASRRIGRPKRFNQPVKHRVCKECDYVAASDERMASHIEKVHTVGTMYMCSMCNYECKWNKNFYNHMREHFNGPPYQCDQEGCPFQADRIQLIIQHRARHFGDRQFQCKECGMRFLSKNNLLAHKKTHTGLRPFECGECQRTFATKNTLSQHMVVHSDDRPYLCDTCGFSSKYQSHLIAHRRIHTGEVYHCQFPQCAYFTPKRSQLKGHMRAHLGIRCHVCSQCGKAFVEKSHLTRHERLHNNERPHKCMQCDYQSTRRDKLREHEKKHDAELSVFKGSKLKRRSRKNNGNEWPPTQVPLEQTPTTDDVPNSELLKIAQIVAGEHGYHRKLPLPASESPGYLSQFSNQNSTMMRQVQLTQNQVQITQNQPTHPVSLMKNEMASPQDHLVHSTNINPDASQGLIVSHINTGRVVPEIQQQTHQYGPQGGGHNMPVAMADIAGLVSMATPSTSGVVTASNGQHMQQDYDNLGNFMTFL